jgi:hypothetical protein
LQREDKVRVKSPSLSHPVVIKAEEKLVDLGRIVPALLFEKKGMIPVLQQLLVSHSKVTA